MIDKKTASKLYAMNQMGSMNGDPKPKRRKGGQSNDAVKVCTKDNPGGCGWASEAGQPSNAQNQGGAKGLSKKPLHGDSVLNKRQAAKQAKKVAKIRQEAADRSRFNSDRRKF